MSRPFVPLADGAQAIIRYGLGIGVVTTRLFFVRRSGVVSSTTLQELADGLQLLVHDEILPLLSDDITLTNCWAIDWTTQFGTLIASAGPTGLGGINSPSLSAICAARVIIKAAQPPRNFKNYNFVPGIPESKVTLNTLDATWRNNLRVAYADIIDAAAVWGTFPAWRWVCTSQESAGSPLTTQEAHRADVISVAPTVRQRRRRSLVT